MTEDECLAIGGHCWKEDDELLMTYPPKIRRRCKHCGKRQIGTAQPSMNWRDE